MRLSEEQISSIRQALEKQDKIEPVLAVEIKDEAGEVVAEAQKRLRIRKRKDGLRNIVTVSKPAKRHTSLISRIVWPKEWSESPATLA